MFRRFINTLRPSIKYAVFTTTATLIMPIVLVDKTSLTYLQNINNVTYCDSDESKSTPSLIEQADAAAEKAKSTIKVPGQFENIKNLIQQSSVNTYDGFRFQVQKQVNLNTVVSHL